MSLYGSIRLAANTLRADQIALQVVGQNIANANTPGYIREEVLLTPAAAQRKGKLLLGLGVNVEAVVQKIDHFLEERLRGAVSERMGAETEESTYMQLESVIGELSDTDLSTAMSAFFNSMNEVLNQPESVSVRNLAVLQGVTLSADINRLGDRVLQMRTDLNRRVSNMADDINRLTEEIRVLNIRIANTEGGDVSASDAVGLRDQRLVALERLSELVDIRVQEQPSGGVAVYAGGDFLVFEGTSRQVEIGTEGEDGLSLSYVKLSDIDARLNPAGGELAGLMAARDEILGGFLDRLDDFAGNLAFEFNKVYSQGQGLHGYRQLTSEFGASDTAAALSDAGLVFTPTNGSFQVIVRNKQTDQTKTTDITVDLNGIGDETSLEDLTAALDAVEGLSAEVTLGGKLALASDSVDQEFIFSGDTSGVLAALGLNTFFSGSSARDIGVNQVVRDDPATFAASRGGLGVDTDNAVELAAFLDRPIASRNNASLTVLYDRLTSETTQASAITQAAAEGARTFETTLRGQKLATSGVSLDEEAVRMMAFQRSFQASARYITTLSELLGMLVQL